MKTVTIIALMVMAISRAMALQIGEIGVVDARSATTSRGPVLVGIDERAAWAAQGVILLGDIAHEKGESFNVRDAIIGLGLEGQAYLVEQGTKVQLLSQDRRAVFYEIRMLEGKFNNATGFIPKEWVVKQ
jgi:hypothetical protein